MSCQGNKLKNAFCATRNGVSKVASMSASAAGSRVAPVAEKAKSAASAAMSKVAPVAEKAKPVVSAISGKAQAIAGSGVVQYGTRGPRAFMGYRQATIQAQGRVARAVGGFIKDVYKSERAFGQAERENDANFKVAEKEYKKAEEEGTKKQEVGVTGRQILQGLGGYTLGTAFSGGNQIIGVAAGITAAKAAQKTDRKVNWQRTSEGQEAWNKLSQADNKGADTSLSNLEAHKQSLKSAAKNLFSEVKGARNDLKAGRKAAWRTVLGRA